MICFVVPSATGPDRHMAVFLRPGVSGDAMLFREVFRRRFFAASENCCAFGRRAGALGCEGADEQRAQQTESTMALRPVISITFLDPLRDGVVSCNITLPRRAGAGQSIRDDAV
jgi:hypothetical protein